MEFTYPQGLKKALTFSYDDGREFDRRLVEIFNQHGLKGTFHLNSGTLGLHAPNGDFVAPGEVKELYQGHEVAVHTVSHLHPMSSPLSQVSREIAEDRKALEALTGGLVVGMSYPYGCYFDEVVAVAKAQGILYSRTTVATGEFHLPADFLRWHSTCHHGDPRLLDLGKKFLAAPDMGLSLMYVWGHSFEFAWGDSWHIIEDFAALMGGQNHVWYCTNIQLCRYVSAIRAVELSADGKLAYNPTGETLWYESNGQVSTLAPGECKAL